MNGVFVFLVHSDFYFQSQYHWFLWLEKCSLWTALVVCASPLHYEVSFAPLVLCCEQGIHIWFMYIDRDRPTLFIPKEYTPNIYAPNIHLIPFLKQQLLSIKTASVFSQLSPHCQIFTDIFCRPPLITLITAICLECIIPIESHTVIRRQTVPHHFLCLRLQSLKDTAPERTAGL